MEKLSLKEIIFALVESIDLVNYLLRNHHRRVTYIAYEIGKQMSLDKHQLRRLVLSAALHDIGALYVKERDELIRLDIENPHPHAIRGAILLKEFNYFEEISDIILHHHRAYDDGKGLIFNHKEVPIESFIIHIADRVEILYDSELSYYAQVDNIKHQIIKRTHSIFTPECVSAFVEVSENESFWLGLESIRFSNLLHGVFDSKEDIDIDLEVLEHISSLFANIVDSRSLYTASHSKAVAEVAYELCQLNGLDNVSCEKIRIAGLLHDLGKIGIPNEIVEKEGKLTFDEYEQMKSHAYYTYQILKEFKGLEDICKWASMHHEKRDGLGYPFHISNDDFSIEMDILAISDVFTAISEDRPYRSGMKVDEIHHFIEEEFRHRIDPDLLKLLIKNMDKLNLIRKETQERVYEDYDLNNKKISQMTDQLNGKAI